MGLRNSQRSSGEMSSDASIGVPLHIESSASSNSSADSSSISKKHRWQKFIFLFIIIVVAIVSTTLVFTFTATESDQEFKDYAKNLSENFNRVFKNKVSNAKALAQSLASDAKYYNTSWPNVIIPGFDARCFSNFNLNSETLIFAPLVKSATREPWLSFAKENEEISGTQGSNAIYRYESGNMVPDDCAEPCFVSWQKSSDLWNSENENAFLNLYSAPGLDQAYKDLILRKSDQIGEYIIDDKTVTTALVYPIVKLADDSTNGSLVGALQIDIDFESNLKSIALSFSGTATVSVRTATGTTYFFDILEGSDVKGISSPEDNLQEKENCGYQSLDGRCFYWLKVYKTSNSENPNNSSSPFIIIIIIVSVLNILAFAIYFFIMERRRQSTKNNNIVGTLSSLVRNQNADDKQGNSRQNQSENGDSVILEPAKTRLRTFLRESERTTPEYEDLVPYKYDAPIADLFPETTVMFADIAGFTAWSSEREPSQIFYLLESVYRTFDSLATKFGVFKVETIGDCYVAVTGLPDPSEDHAVIMAEFSYECLSKVTDLMKSLEVKLGPGTSDLRIRVGLHSGTVTAGVLRGEKARFQLFGDTMNTAARMESTGVAGRIQASQDTADLLVEASKGYWLVARHGIVNVNGKGDMSTFWVEPKREPSNGTESTDASGISTYAMQPEMRPKGKMPRRFSRNADNWGESDVGIYGVDADKKARLVNWNVEVLGDLLAKVVAWRSLRNQQRSTGRRRSSNSEKLDSSQIAALNDSDDESEDENKTVIDEVSEVIHLPRFTEQTTRVSSLVQDASTLSGTVKAQLHDYITRIANCYRNVPFHNLEHASHVTLSANKLMMQIISPGESDFDNSSSPPEEQQRKLLRKRSSRSESRSDLQQCTAEAVERNLHVSTFGISSDPLCQLAIVFSALIHDVDHSGLPNAQLVKEKQAIAATYKNQSVAEQNSVDISWAYLMEDQYQALRDCIFVNDAELRRFRQLVVNSVMATDIVDQELKQLRDNRWAKAFDISKLGSLSEVDINRKATIVIEHIIQASDVAHTMQHWHIYIKWNEKLFCEMYTAYLGGRADKDPSQGWYEGELWFFDNYIIPLAKKLKECGVFGVAGDEYLSYAEENREEWQRKGKDKVEKMLKAYKQRHGGMVTTRS